ncbi:MAG TPA: metallophosphoesterase [Candidatus Hydrogenedens sp.]|nr:metallophosphoesterase [Candidatus Hydrogenedens sp.]
MMFRAKKICFFYICVIYVLVSYFSAYARLEDRTLGIIKIPNEGCPVILAPGQTFKVTSEQKGELFLIDNENQILSLTAQWESLTSNLWEALVTLIGKGIKEGPYSLQIITETKTKDINPRSVWVQNSFKEFYTFAHISDIHIRSNDPDDEQTSTFQEIIEKLNRCDAHFILITGDLTHDATMEQWGMFLKILNQCKKPTFVCAGNHDRNKDNYENMFHTSTYAFRYGKDGYIVYDTKEYRVADSRGEQDTLLYRYSRELKSSRWMFGITHRYEFTMGIRAQIILFVDDPIDFILYGHTHRENTKEESILPWGKTHVYVVPAGKDGYYRIYDVGEGGILPRPIQNIKDHN